MISITIDKPTVEQAVQEMNTARRTYSGEWITHHVTVNGLKYAFKTFDTWTRVFKSDGIRCTGAHGLNVTQWKEECAKFLSY